MKTDDDLLAIARSAVPPHLQTLGRIVRHPQHSAHALAAAKPGASAAPTDDELAQQIAATVGAELAPDENDSADVEFVEHTPIGARSTVVQIRGGKVARVLKRA